MTIEHDQALSADEFDALFDEVRYSAFRYEGLPVYAVDEEDEDLAAWRTGRAMAERSVRTDPWLARIALQTILSHVHWSRVRYVTSPPSWYVAWEVASYVESQAAGERILLTGEKLWDGPDFWLLDAGTPHARAVIQTYGPDGGHIRNELVPGGSQRVADLERLAPALVQAATPLNHWLVKHRDELLAAGVHG